MQFTKSQTKAIESRGKDMLVSAGAGSGKTTVLATRLIERIKQGGELKEFLVATFTNASAADFKAKLAEKLIALSGEDPQNKRYQRQLYALPTADIGTIDSFCLKYVKQYAPFLGLGGVSVGDEALCASILRECIDTVITDACGEEAPYIDVLLDNFAGHKSEDGLVSVTAYLYGKMRSYPFYKDWLCQTVDDYVKEQQSFTPEGFFNLPHGAMVKAAINAELAPMLTEAKQLFDFAEDDKQYAFAEKVYRVVKNIAESLGVGYGAFSACMAQKEALRRPSKSPEGYVALYNDINDRRKKLAEFVRTEEELKQEYELTAQVLLALKDFLLRVDDTYRAEKNRRGIIDFADGEQLFLTLLVDKTPAGLVKTPLCQELSAAYSEVFIDEYQDISPLQDTIFKLIAKGKRLMVGDVKQSIYGFRNAYPDLFLSYCKDFDEAGEGNGIKVLLKENFRCDKSIIDFCNYLFSKIYTVETAGSNYTEEALVYGKGKGADLPVTVRIFENTEDTVAETEETVREIVRLIEGGTKPSDIAVLCRKANTLRDYGAALSACGVPTSLTVGKEELLKRPEVLLAISALRVIDNPTDDISLAALLRSPIFRFTAAELMAIRRGGVSLYDDLRHAAVGFRLKNKAYKCRMAAVKSKKLSARPMLQKGTKDALAEKCTAFLEKLSTYRTKALFLPVHKLLWFFYEETNIMSYAPLGQESAYRANLLSFYRLAMGVENNSYKGVSVFTEYLQNLEKGGSSPSAEKTADTDGVRLMTIHGSKGLEFPVVFVCDCGSKIQKANRRQPLAVSYSSGISIKLKRQAEALSLNTLLRRAELMAEDRRCIAEELRILYVAFTRAAEKLYISMSLEDTAIQRIEAEKEEKYGDLFLNAVAMNREMFYNIHVTDGQARRPPLPRLKAGQEDEGNVDLPSIRPMPPKAQRVTAKYSASDLEKAADGILQLRQGALVTDREPSFGTATDYSGADKGTANHLFMQFANYANAAADPVAEADRLLALGFVTEDQRRIMDMDALGRFFQSPLYADMARSPRVYREKRFTTRVSGKLFGGGEETPLLQGVIDCFFQNASGGFTLVDYKSDRIRPGEEALLIKRHGVQLGLYKSYIEKVTAMPVNKVYIYSFALNKAIDCGNPAEL